MTNRELRLSTIVRLLETYRDALGSATEAGEGTTDKGDRLLLMSPLYHQGSYQALEEILKAMREARRNQWWHVSERYLKAERRRRPVRLQKKRGMVEPVTGPHQEYIPGSLNIQESVALVWEWRPQVRNEKVRRGLDWIDAEFERRGKVPQLPRELMEAA